jgi:predicted ATPase with chaperone activity
MPAIPNLPPRPISVTETDLSFGFVADLTLKTIYVRGFMLGRDIADALKLPLANVMDKVLEYLRHDRLIEVQGAAGVGEASYQYAITNAGQSRARELMDRNQYVGPAPVSLAAYTAVVNAQSLVGQSMAKETLKRALSHLVLGDDIVNELGPVINSGRPLFLYGNTGNGKTSIGLAIGNMLPGAIWIPYAISVEGEIIKVFDAGRHRVLTKKTSDDRPSSRKGLLSYLTPGKTDEGEETPALKGDERYDERWLLVQRPLIVGGGELTLKNLDLVFDPEKRYYEAPQQLKANGGMFLLDDLGRQQVSPQAILNRWTVPLEKRVDYMTLAIGYKFQVPFDTFVVFATNLNPKDLADEAFLRRIRNKVHVTDPTWEQFREIFRREAVNRKIPFTEPGFQYLIAEHYRKPKREPRGVHPRDLLDALVDIARSREIPPTLSNELIDLACQSYFLTNRPSESG